MFKVIPVSQKNSTKRIFALLCIIVYSFALNAQENKQQQKDVKAAQTYLSEAQQFLKKDKFAPAEADYRKAISLNPKSEVAKYNLGTAYYGKEKNAEAQYRFQQAASTATNKSEKHKAFHNLGNTYMNEKKYQEAVNAYKNALRNNPNDDETRYNLALAKDMLEKNPPPPEDQNKDDKNKDQDKKDPKDQEDKKEDGENDEKEDKEKGDQDKDKGKQDEPKEEDGEKPQQKQPVPGQLSPQQVKNLLEAMNNEEKKTQDKINAEKQKGAKVKSDKDW